MLQESEYFAESKLFHGLVPAALGSKLDVLLIGLEKEAADAFWKKTCALCENVEDMLNGDNPESEIGRFNAGKMLAHSAVSEELGDAVDLCKEYVYSTSGLFDPAFGKMNYVDHDEDDGSLSFYGVKLDLGSFSRGYMLKEIRSLLLSSGVESAFLNLGNYAFVAVGHHPYGESWKVTLTNPFTRMPIEDVELKDATLALSCNAPGSLGRVIDPATGRGNEERKMTVAIASDPLDAKVLATSLMVADSSKTEDLKESFPDAELKVYRL